MVPEPEFFFASDFGGSDPATLVSALLLEEPALVVDNFSEAVSILNLLDQLRRSPVHQRP
jgi:hypothetical protein